MGLPVQVTTVNAPYQAASYTGVLPDESRLGSDRQPAGHKPITGYYLANPLIPLYEWPTIHSGQRMPPNADAFLPRRWWEGLFSTETDGAHSNA